MARDSWLEKNRRRKKNQLTGETPATGRAHSYVNEEEKNYSYNNGSACRGTRSETGGSSPAQVNVSVTCHSILARANRIFLFTLQCLRRVRIETGSLNRQVCNHAGVHWTLRCIWMDNCHAACVRDASSIFIRRMYVSLS